MENKKYEIRIEKIIKHYNEINQLERNKQELIENNTTKNQEKNNILQYSKKIYEILSLYKNYKKKRISKRDVLPVLNLLSTIFSSKKEEFILIQTLIETIPLLFGLIRNIIIIKNRKEKLYSIFNHLSSILKFSPFGLNIKKKNSFSMIEILISISIFFFFLNIFIKRY
jgi:hypothetical protein